MENNNRQGCRWTKCSEQMPDLSQYAEPELHFRFDGKKVCGVQFMSDGFEVKILSIYHGFYNKDLHRLEYLDESIEPCATSSENYWKQRYDVEMDEQKLIEIFKRVSLWDLSECKFEYEKEDTGNHWCNAELNGRVIDSIIWDGNIFSMMNNNGTFSPLNPMLYYSPSPTGDRDCEELKKALSGLYLSIVDKNFYNSHATAIKKAKQLLNL